MLTIIDLDIGNLQSVINAFHRIGAEASVVRAPEEVQNGQILVLPGVGAFERAMSQLNQRGFTPFIREHTLDRRRPVIGICLGMQLFAERSYEHGTFGGLGLIPGEVVALQPKPPDDRIPNIGWLPVEATKSSVMFPEGINGQSFYHVHSYHLECRDLTDIAATINFGGRKVVTAVERENIFGMQFHPEKSQDAGLNLLSSLMSHLTSHSM